MVYKDEFRIRFTELTGKLGINFVDGPKVIGISKGDYLSIASFGVYPSVKCAIKIADFFNVSLDYLLGISHNDSFVKSQNPTTIGERLKELASTTPHRTMLRVTKIGSDNYYYWKNGKRFPSKWKYVIAIAEFYGVSLDYLFGRSDVR